MQVFFILFSVHFAVYQYINSKCLYRTHVIYTQCMLNVCSIYAHREPTVTNILFLVVFKDLVKTDENEILL